MIFFLSFFLLLPNSSSSAEGHTKRGVHQPGQGRNPSFFSRPVTEVEEQQEEEEEKRRQGDHGFMRPSAPSFPLSPRLRCCHSPRPERKGPYSSARGRWIHETHTQKHKTRTHCTHTCFGARGARAARCQDVQKCACIEYTVRMHRHSHGISHRATFSRSLPKRNAR